ncbi:MAG: 16S rRNA (guanine(966)-N(2))-methyltransferase RsmD [Flavobacteriales bacterium]
MRIIRGSLSRKRLKAPKNLPVRPTTDMAKEALFNILDNQYYFEDLKVLDLCSGTGNIAYEFASRGSEHIVAVDRDPNCVKFIKSTAEDLDLNAVLQVVQSDMFEFLEKSNQSFDLIFADPPYDFENYNTLVDAILESDQLNPEALVIIEHPKQTSFDSHLFFEQERKYGKVHFSFFSKSSQ